MSDNSETATTQSKGIPAQQKPGGVRIRMLNVVMICLVTMVSLVFLQTAQSTRDTYYELEDASNRYIACEAASNNLKEASNYLTIQVRTFAVTQDPTYLEKYFEEAVVTQRREQAVSVLADNLPAGEARSHLDQALEESRELMNREYYSMKLVCEACGLSVSENAAALDEVELSAADKALSREDKIAKATDLVYDEEYTDEVASIENNVTLCKSELVKGFESLQEQNSTELHDLLLRQQVFTWLMFLLVVALILLFIVLVLWPIQHYVTRIAANEPLPMQGSYELRYLAREYNVMYEESLRSRSQLQKEAEHDHLTGLYNRGVFERMLYSYREESIALLLIDADYFKTVNDTLGHDGGDAMLQKLANQLSKAFRSSDYPCRIGGDEFAVIMTNADPSISDVIARKISQVAEFLRDDANELPPATISVGIAFGSPDCADDKLFQAADAALYDVKRRGRDGFAFAKETPR